MGIKKKRGGHEAGRRPPSWAPRSSTDLLLPPMYTHIPRNQPGSRRNPISTAATFCTHEIPSWGLFWSSAGGGIDHGGLLHQHHSLSDDVFLQSSPRSSWRSIRCNLLLRCVCQDPMNCGFMIKFIYEKYLNLL